MNGNQKSTYYKILYCTPKVETLCMVHLEGLKSVHRIFSFFEGLHKLCINCVYTRSLSSAPLVRQVVKSSRRCFGGGFGELRTFTGQEVHEFVLALFLLEPFFDAFHLAMQAMDFSRQSSGANYKTLDI